MQPRQSVDDAVWTKSSFCENSVCVEVASLNGAHAVRDSAYPAGGLLVFDPAAWSAFIAGVKAGEFD